MRIAIQKEIARSEERITTISCTGLQRPAANRGVKSLKLFGEDGTTVQRWVHRFEEGGLDALCEG